MARNLVLSNDLEKRGELLNVYFSLHQGGGTGHRVGKAFFKSDVARQTRVRFKRSERAIS